MSKLSEPNPYEILGLNPNVDKSSLTNAFVKKNRGSSQERMQARMAYDKLRKVDERCLVDAFLPLISDDGQDIHQVIQQLLESNQPVEWSQELNLDIDLQEQLEKLTLTIIQEFFNEMPQNEVTPELLSDYDDLEGFLDSWLK